MHVGEPHAVLRDAVDRAAHGGVDVGDEARKVVVLGCTAGAGVDPVAVLAHVHGLFGDGDERPPVPHVEAEHGHEITEVVLLWNGGEDDVDGLAEIDPREHRRDLRDERRATDPEETDERVGAVGPEAGGHAGGRGIVGRCRGGVHRCLPGADDERHGGRSLRPRGSTSHREGEREKACAAHPRNVHHRSVQGARRALCCLPMTPRVRVAPLAAMFLVGGLVAVAASNCASPTQIIVDVRVDSALCAKVNTGIAVTTLTTIDTANLSTYQDGCRAAQADGQSQVGALTITPSGSNDAEVGIRIVAAVGSVANPDACGRTDIDGKADWSSCILARRTTRFAPGETVTITVRLTSDCVGQFCGDRECNAGVCVRPEQIEDDGGTSLLDAEVVPFDTGSDAYVDAGDDACSHYCVGPGARCNGNTCTIDCTGENTRCDSTVSCGGALDCAIKCGDKGSCNQVSCTTTGKCSFDCTGTGAAGGVGHCVGISCRGSECTVACSNTKDTCDGVFLDAGKSSVRCDISGGNNPSCRDLHCASNDGTCARTCTTNGKGCEYGDRSSCTGNCDGWEDAGDGGN